MVYEELYSFDADIRDRTGFGLICGVDEAGRGPLAGPVSCAAVILPPEVRFDGLTDSKKVSPLKRERLYDEIISAALAYSCVLVDNTEIDKVNILNATMRGMTEAVKSLKISPDYALVDGNRAPKLMCPDEAVVKGDARSASIAAASIIAKITRDRYMLGLSKEYPEYGFEKHKGYPTKAHYEAIEKYGITPCHRLTFLKGIV